MWSTGNKIRSEINPMNIKELIQPYKDLVINTRRDLHRIPEVAYTEEKTSAYVADYLKREGLAVTTGIARYGVVGLLETGRPGPTLLVRADMDALPIHEETGLPLRPATPGPCTPAGTTATWPWGWSPPPS
jgi:metal-dependent amidase/aminoacylase/carboxypeptidase family protein